MKVGLTNAAGDGVNIEADVEQSISQLWDGFLSLFGKDADSVETKRLLRERTAWGIQRTSTVQVVGMNRPVPLCKIYQPTRLLVQNPKPEMIAGGPRSWMELRPELITVEEFLAQQQNSVITAGAGYGKTTFLNATFLNLLKARNALPILFVLREQGEVDELESFIERLEHLKKRLGAERLVVLVDGYDEISTESRRQVSRLLNKLELQRCGQYLLTCRNHYDIYDLKCRRVQISDFTREDRISFMDAYFDIYERGDLRSRTILDDLERRGFGDLLRHPLLLTLACITQTSTLSSNLLGSASLIDSAISTLSLRWYQAKMLAREVTTPLSSVERQKILKRLAASFPIEPVPEHRAVGVTQGLLEKMSHLNVEPLDVLREIAQFYGIFVPIERKWGFVHRSLQDYLAAQRRVETGEFATSVAEDSFPLNSSTAFAGCLLEDATEVMLKVLTRDDEKAVVRVMEEMFLNNPTFDHQKVWKAIESFVARQKFYYDRNDDGLWCNLSEEFITAASSTFLNEVVQMVCKGTTRAGEVLTAYAVSELMRRKEILPAKTYSALTNHFSSKWTTIQIQNRGSIKVAQLLHEMGPADSPPR
jgi:hypothetical protein